MSAPDMPGLEAPEWCEATQVSPTAWGAIVDVMMGEGPTPPASVSQREVHKVVADLEIVGWSVRPCAHGGWFAWSEAMTAYCAAPEDLRALVRKAMREHKAACKAEGKGVRQSHTESMADSIGRLTPAGKASPRWDRAPKPVKADRPAVDRASWRDDFFTALGRQLVRFTARHDEGSSS